ncbi:MAG: LCP family protein [Ilumatobacteraceae bacterium]
MPSADPKPIAVTRRRRVRSPLPWTLGIAAVVGLFGAAGVLRAADARTADIERVGGLDGVLADLPDFNDPNIEYPAENYLLVGSDTREGGDESSPDFGGIGSAAEVTGRRSDTIMILRQERNGGAALMSLPRDLWVEIAGTGESQRINSAYNEGADRLAATVSQSIGIPIHHYVEVDFFGFKDIIDGLGGVEVCVAKGARDANTGLQIDPGCTVLDGVQALAFARSRHYEEWDGSSWVEDPRADLGRIARQQLFMRAAVDGALRRIQSSPFGSGDVIEAVVDAVRIDDRLDPIKAGEALRQAAQDGLRTYSLPVVNDRVGDAAILRLGDGSDEVLAYFRGDGPPPASFETGATASALAGSDPPAGSADTG